MRRASKVTALREVATHVPMPELPELQAKLEVQEEENNRLVLIELRAKLEAQEEENDRLSSTVAALTVTTEAARQIKEQADAQAAVYEERVARLEAEADTAHEGAHITLDAADIEGLK